MKISVQTQTEFIPMLLSRALARTGDDSMPTPSATPTLRLRRPEVEQETDAIPFPRAVSRIGQWQPRPLWPEASGHDAERALEDVNLHLERLAKLLEQDDDRPRAA